MAGDGFMARFGNHLEISLLSTLFLFFSLLYTFNHALTSPMSFFVFGCVSFLKQADFNTGDTPETAKDCFPMSLIAQHWFRWGYRGGLVGETMHTITGLSQEYTTE